MILEELYNGHGCRVSLESAALPDGRVEKTTRIHRCDAVHILAFPQRERVLLLREFRPFYGEWIWMIPSGRVDKENDRDQAAQRELQEETGFRSENLQYWCTTNFTEHIAFSSHIFVARKLVKDPLPQDEHELIEVHELPVEEAIENVLKSPKIHTASAFALLRYTRDFPLGA